MAKKTSKKNSESLNIDDLEVTSPGDCCGNYLQGDDACSICEIQDTCKEMTISLNP